MAFQYEEVPGYLLNKPAVYYRNYHSVTKSLVKLIVYTLSRGRWPWLIGIIRRNYAPSRLQPKVGSHPINRVAHPACKPNRQSVCPSRGTAGVRSPQGISRGSWTRTNRPTSNSSLPAPNKRSNKPSRPILGTPCSIIPKHYQTNVDTIEYIMYTRFHRCYM